MKFLAVVVLCATQAFAYLAYDKEIFRDHIGRPSSNSLGGAEKKCIKDLLLVVDCSYSITKDRFEENVKKFVEQLILDPGLNVGSHGTHVALVVFSSYDYDYPARSRTKILFDFEHASRNADELVEQISKALNWDKVKGDRTETSKALRLAEDIFLKPSPQNHRPDVDDVVLIITDGIPNPAKGNGKKNTARRAQELKDRGVLIVAAAVGDQAEDVATFMKEIATNPKYVVAADFKEMENVRSTIVANSCVKPGQCECQGALSGAVFYVKPGKTKARVAWPRPSYGCGTGGEVEEQGYTVQPNVKSGDSFGIGRYSVVYTFYLNAGVEVNCPISFEVKGPLCRGVSYNSAHQVCCCGTIHTKKDAHDCCGPDYYSTTKEKCCEDANLVSLEKSCE